MYAFRVTGVLATTKPFFNGYLMTPGEMNEFVDSFKSDRVRVHFDTGNIMQYQFPEHWITQLGQRTKNVHLKEFTKKGTDSSLEAFRPLLDGTTNWPAVLEAFDATGYKGYLTFEYFHPYLHYPEALVYQTADSLDRMLGLKGERRQLVRRPRVVHVTNRPGSLREVRGTSMGLFSWLFGGNACPFRKANQTKPNRTASAG